MFNENHTCSCWLIYVAQLFLRSLYDTMDSLIDNAHAVNTKSTYSSSFRQWHRFCDALNCPLFTVNEVKLVAFVAYRFMVDDVCHVTIVKDLSGVRSHFIKEGKVWLERDQLPRLKLALKGVRRLRVVDRSKKPLRLADLRRFYTKLSFISQRNVRLYRAVLAIAFHGMLRVSEYANESSSVLGVRTLRLSNLRWYPNRRNPHTIEILLARSKTSQFGVCKESVAFRCCCDSGICPLHELCSYVDECRAPALVTDPLFIFHDGDIFTTSDMNRLISQLCRACGLPSVDYSSHSMRSGGATELFLAGVPLPLIQKLGRWSPNGYTLQERYAKPSAVLVRQMVEKFEVLNPAAGTRRPVPHRRARARGSSALGSLVGHI